jgi:hypothetical protein
MDHGPENHIRNTYPRCRPFSAKPESRLDLVPRASGRSRSLVAMIRLLVSSFWQEWSLDGPQCSTRIRPAFRSEHAFKQSLITSCARLAGQKNLATGSTMTIWYRQNTGPHLEAGCRWPCRRCHAHDANRAWGRLCLLAILPDAHWSSLIPAGSTDDVKSYRGERRSCNQSGWLE